MGKLPILVCRIKEKFSGINGTIIMIGEIFLRKVRVAGVWIGFKGYESIIFLLEGFWKL
jgi:hypothetical protein